MRNDEENVNLVNETSIQPPSVQSRIRRVGRLIQDKLLDRKRPMPAILLVLFILFVLARVNLSKPEVQGPTAQPTTSTTTIPLDPDESTESPDNVDNGVDLLGGIDDVLDKPDYDFNCTKEEFEQLEKGSKEYLLREADCGTGYPFVDTKKGNPSPANIVLYGEGFKEHFGLSGCPIGTGRCTHHPRCSFVLTTNFRDAAVWKADVIVVTNMDANDIAVLSERSQKPKVRRILYWREAYWPYLSPGVQKNQFDLEMGVHYTSGLVNPNYLRKPKTLIAKSFFEFLPFKDRENFALSIISNCLASSGRIQYIQHLTDYLGPERIHQYGACGTRNLPPKPIKNAAKVIAKYKFYLSLENTVQAGYVTEKLLTILNMPLIPIYLGAFNVPNITTIPSFIKAHDFKTPKHLAEYLLYLDSNPEAYAKYHLWRKDASLFSEEYLNLIKYKFPSSAELKAYPKGNHAIRQAECCRLCNLPFIDMMIEKRTQADLITPTLTLEQINREFFGGGMYKRPGPKARIDVDDASPPVPSDDEPPIEDDENHEKAEENREEAKESVWERPENGA